MPKHHEMRDRSHDTSRSIAIFMLVAVGCGGTSDATENRVQPADQISTPMDVATSMPAPQTADIMRGRVDGPTSRNSNDSAVPKPVKGPQVDSDQAAAVSVDVDGSVSHDAGHAVDNQARPMASDAANHSQAVFDAPPTPTGPTDMGVAPEPDGSAGASSTTNLNGARGALVTSDCRYRGYAYAIDILLSCGDERLGSPLRLHTFKRHSHNHRQVFNDQRIHVRNEQLWFDAYDPPQCIRVDGGGRFQLSGDVDDCAHWRFEAQGDGFRLREQRTGRCARLDGVDCANHRWTGGVECDGVEHRYLPLVVAGCDGALTFQVKDRAPFCANEYPGAACF
ncbi:MAG: hypothetical protein VX589_01400 [Myxococcota bacterium]|nr:hypothetical protein [Myxococcota bacterium]